MAYYFPPQQKPQRWGNFQSVQYAIRKNSEKIFGVDPDSNVLVMPLFFGFPCLDFSGKQNHGTPVGGVAYHSGSLDFDGVDDYVDAGDSTSLQIAGAMTVSAWINVSTLPAASNWDGIVSKGGDASDGAGEDHNYLLILDNANFGTGQAVTWMFENSAGTNYQARWITTLSSGLRHLVGVYNTNTNQMILYNNGVAVATTNSITATPTTNSQTAMIGRNRNGVAALFYFNGLIDEVRISNVALTAEQIALFYARPWDLYKRVGRTYYSISAAPSIYIPQIMIF